MQKWIMYEGCAPLKHIISELSKRYAWIRNVWRHVEILQVRLNTHNLIIILTSKLLHARVKLRSNDCQSRSLLDRSCSSRNVLGNNFVLVMYDLVYSFEYCLWLTNWYSYSSWNGLDNFVNLYKYDRELPRK